MINKLYIKKCIMKNPREYVNIAVIITICITVINIMSIYMDSNIYGDELRRFEITKGAEIWIKNATPNDFMYFKGLGVAETKYENGTVYVTLYNERDFDNIRKEVNEIIKRNGLNVDASMSYSEMVHKSSVPVEMQILFNVLKLIFTAIGTVSIYFIYTMFIANKKKDIGILSALGIRKKQLFKLLFLELFVIYTVSFIAALIISNGLMYILIRNFLSVKHENWVYIMYKFSISSAVSNFILSLVSLAAAFVISTKKILSASVIETMKNSSINPNINRNINIWNKTSAVKYISKANMLRNKKHFLISSLLSIPTICICIVILNYTNLLTRPAAENDFSISVEYGEAYSNAELISDNIELLKNVNEIEDISYQIYFNNFFINIDNTKLYLPTFTTVDGINYAHVSINVIKNSDIGKYRNKSKGNIDNYNLENHVIISKNIKKLKYTEGDKIYVGTYAIKNVNASLNKKENMRELTIAGFIDTVQYDSFMNIYVTEENFERITGYPPVPTIINVNLKDGADIEAVRSELYEIFDEESFNILDNIYRQEVGDQLYAGIVILIVFLCSSLFMCIIILLWAFISYYIHSQKTQIHILDMIGAYIKTIVQIFVLESAAKALVNSVAGIVSGTLISHFVLKTVYSGILVNVYAFIIYGLIFVITMAAHVIPSFAAVNSIIEEEK